MKQRPRIYYAQLFDRNHSSISRILTETGGIRPAQRCRSQFALSLAEREDISRALAAGRSVRSIACPLGCAPSTVSREIERNACQGCYRATRADQATWDRARRPKTCKLVYERIQTPIQINVQKMFQQADGFGATCRSASSCL